ncbi:hypothetical protein [Okeania sp.]|uniref:hypothetical protein n=1 Tax=Okeania sp. TaxID=3100323 RepID=UPI002B4AFFD2|nr:hypothetical protein [Okeania sp.]MEB3342414.1 hypothetical protein [Okeania sp.]
MYITYGNCSCCSPIFNHFLFQILRRKFLEGTKNFSEAIMRSNLQASKIQVDKTSGAGVDNRTPTLSDTANPDISPIPNSGEVIIYTAQKIMTMEAAQPEIKPSKTPEGNTILPAVAVEGDTILAVGTLEQVQRTLKELNKEYSIDDTFENKVILPGFVEHHLHPLLGAMTMAVEIISIEDWTLPGKESKAAHNEEDYQNRLVQALQNMDENNPQRDETLFTWGYHQYFHSGEQPLYRKELDDLYQHRILEEEEQKTPPEDYRPIVIWHRSCHEFIFNTAALNKYGIDQGLIDNANELAQSQADLENGHFFEKGLEVILGNIVGDFLSEERINNGVDMLRKYLISKGVTTICEPGTQMNQDYYILVIPGVKVGSSLSHQISLLISNHLNNFFLRTQLQQAIAPLVMSINFHFISNHS